jgi:hypothetical protein
MKNRKEWEQSIIAELTALIDMGVFEIVKDEPHYNKLELKLVYKTKRDTKGLEIKKKTRCVVRGFLQIKGIDYFKCHSSVVRKESLRILCALAASQGKRIYQADIKNAYPFSPWKRTSIATHPSAWNCCQKNRKEK